jgi:ABC-type sugar transport system permease subunit
LDIQKPEVFAGPHEVKWSQVKYHKEIYFFLVPTLILIGLFCYYPAASGIYHSFFRWNGADFGNRSRWR